MSKSIYSPFALPEFRLLWTGGMVSNLGTMVQAVGAGWLMATISTSNDMVALVQSATTLPVMLFSIFAGTLADSYERRRVLIVAQILMMVTSVVLAGVAFTGLITPWLLLAFTFLIGCGTALHTPSWQASVGDVVPREDISSAVTLNSIGLNLTRSIGPAFGGFVVAAAGAASAFAFNAVSFLPMLYALHRWRSVPKADALPREDFGRAVGSGLSYVAMSPHLLNVILRSLVFGMVAISILALLPLVARDLIVGSAATYGLALGAFGAGAIAGGLSNSRIRQAFGNEAIVRGAFLGIGISAALVALSSNIWLTCLFLLPAGASWVLALSLFNVVVQLSTPRWVLGRTLAIYQTGTFGGMTAGGWLWGSVAQNYGISVALLVSAAAALGGAAIGLRFALPAFESRNLDPFNHFREPHLQLDLRPRTGPILILIEYDIEPRNVQAFLTTMAERRRIRIRDGGRQWTLLRDVENPERWKESYHVPTWIEYLRHRQRRTQADAENSDRLAALNRDGQRPHVSRMVERFTVPSVDDMAIKQHVHLP